MFKIRDDFDLEKLVDYGFYKNTGIAGIDVWIYDIDNQDTKESSILINTIEYQDRVLRFYYQDDLEDIELEDGIILDCIDYAIPIPDVLFDLIQQGIVVKVEE